MPKHVSLLVVAISLSALAGLAATSAEAVTLTPIAGYSGYDAGGAAATGTGALAINNAGWITGEVSFADNTQQAFLRDPTGQYSLFSYSADDAGRAIDASHNVVVQTYANPVSGRGEEILRTADGVSHVLTDPLSGKPLYGIAQGINGAGTIVGSYQTATNGRLSTKNGYGLDASSLTGGGGATPTLVNLPFQQPRGINDAGTIVGFATDANTFNTVGVVYTGGANPTTTYVDHPGDANGTLFDAINNHGLVAGNYTDANNLIHAFTYDVASQAVSDIAIPGSTYTQSLGINDLGQQVVVSDAGSFIYDPAGGAQTVFMPLSGSNLPVGVNQFSFNVVPGQTYFVDPASATGFEYTAGTGPDFTSVTAPAGLFPSNSYEVWIKGHNRAWVFDSSVTGGQAFTFATPVSDFELRGIPSSVGVDPSGIGFVTGLTFASAGAFNGEQIALTASAPEPATWALMLIGVGGLGSALRRRRSAIATV